MLMTTEPVSFGARLKTLREAAKLSQESLAQASGLTVSLIAKLEQGRTADPRLSTLRALARALGVRIEDLTGDTEK